MVVAALFETSLVFTACRTYSKWERRKGNGIRTTLLASKRVMNGKGIDFRDTNIVMNFRLDPTENFCRVSFKFFRGKFRTIIIFRNQNQSTAYRLLENSAVKRTVKKNVALVEEFI